MISKEIKNIIIVSEYDDKSTNLVTEWLHYYSKSFKRYNDNSFFDLSIRNNENITNILEKYNNHVFWISRSCSKFTSQCNN